jgi:flagellar biosynthesis anti-sigma factor FlgM
MKIDRSSLSPIGGVQAVNRLGQVEKKKSVLTTESDKVAVSDKAQVYQTLLQKAKELPSVREDRVSTLAEQIERGEFQVDAQKIADKLSSFDF